MLEEEKRGKSGYTDAWGKDKESESGFVELSVETRQDLAERKGSIPVGLMAKRTTFALWGRTMHIKLLARLPGSSRYI